MYASPIFLSLQRRTEVGILKWDRIGNFLMLSIDYWFLTLSSLTCNMKAFFYVLIFSDYLFAVTQSLFAVTQVFLFVFASIELIAFVANPQF